MVIPKYLGGWGLKNIFLFYKELVEKSVWRLIYRENIWTRVVTHKYIRPNSLQEWIRSSLKKYALASIIWKSLVSSFDLIGDGLELKAGNGKKLHLGKDPWLGSRGFHLLPKPLIQNLHDKGLVYLAQVGDPVRTIISSKEWKTCL
jgi:hypothetical protein